MKISKKRLEEMIIEEARLLLEKPEADKKDIFGQYLLAPDRPDTPNPKEPDTDKEEALRDALNSHYHGGMDELNPWIKPLDKLEDAGKYTKVLTVPKKYQYAYRFMDIDPRILQKILAGIVTPEQLARHEDGKWRTAKGGTFYGKLNTGGRLARQHFSWTVNLNVVKKIEKDWDTLFYGEDNFFVIMKAKIHGDGNEFLLNPDMMAATGIPGSYAYQQEIVSVGNVNLNRIAYVFNFGNKKLGTGAVQALRPKKKRK